MKNTYNNSNKIINYILFLIFIFPLSGQDFSNNNWTFIYVSEKSVDLYPVKKSYVTSDSTAGNPNWNNLYNSTAT